MNIAIVSKLKLLLRRLWEQWSAVQDQQDELWQSEIGEETPSRESTDEVGSCGIQKQPADSQLGGALDLGDLIDQRNAEHDRSQSNGESEKN